jgi:hypothetical protein
VTRPRVSIGSYARLATGVAASAPQSSREPRSVTWALACLNASERNHSGRIQHAGLTHLRIRVLLYAGQPSWDLLPTITPAGLRGARISLVLGINTRRKREHSNRRP